MIKIIVTSILFAASVSATAGEAVLIHLTAQHFSGDYWNEQNYGLGYETSREINGHERLAGIGILKDSVGNMLPHAGFGIRLQLSDRVSAGAALTLMYRQENILGEKVGLIVAPLPMMEVDMGRTSLVMTYLPSPRQLPTDSAAILFSFKVHL